MRQHGPSVVWVTAPHQRLGTEADGTSPAPQRPAAYRFPGYSLGRVVVVALAFTLLGFGLARVSGGSSGGANRVDVGFAQDMIDHHDQAMIMAVSVLHKDGIGANVRNFASEVLIFQRWETGTLDAYLAQWSKERGDLDRQAMAWMGMSSSVATMPGMQSPEQIDALDSAVGAEAERLFLTMMRDHHRGGSHMATYAAEHGADADVVDMATRMARNQLVEANEYTALLQRLGLEG